MTRFNALLVFELRRHLPMVLAGWSLWSMLFLVHRLVVGHWRFWDSSDFALISAATMILMVAPLLAVALVFAGWPQERAAGMYRWLLARPLSLDALFAGRLLAILIAVGVYVAGALLLNGLSPLQFLAGWLQEIGGSKVASHRLLGLQSGGAVLSWLLVILVLIALAVLVSVLSRGAGNALGWWGLIAVAAVGLGVAFQVYLDRVGQVAWWQPRAVARHLMLHDSLWLVALTLAAWGVFRRSAVGRGRAWRGLLWGAVPAILALTVLSRLLVQPSSGSEARPILARAVEGGTLELVQGRFTRLPISMLRLRRTDGTVEAWPDLPVARMGLYLSPDRRRALLQGAAGEGLHLLDLTTGETTPVAGTAWFDRMLNLDPGWSPSGELFVWLDGYADRPRLLSIDRQGLLRQFEIPTTGHAFDAAWLDESRLLLSWMNRDAEGGFFGECHWGVLSLGDAALALQSGDCLGRLDFIGGRLDQNAVQVAGEVRPSHGLVTRWPACLVEGGVCQLGLVDPLSGEVERTEVRLSWEVRPSLGVGQGSVFWLEPRAVGGHLVRRWRPGHGVDTPCQLPSLPRLTAMYHYTGFLAASEGWAVWQDLDGELAGWNENPGRLVACDLTTGEVRVVDSERLSTNSAEFYQGELILPGRRVPFGT